MKNNLQATLLRSDIVTMKDIVHHWPDGTLPDTETREKITKVINEACVHQVTDRTTPEDIDRGEFRYAIHANHLQKLIVKVKFMH